MWLNIIICGIWNKRQSKCLNLSNCLFTTILLIPFYVRLRSLNKSLSSEVEQRVETWPAQCRLSLLVHITFCYYLLDIFLLVVFGNHSTFVCFLVPVLFYKICFFGTCYRDKASHIFWISRAGFYQINAWLLIIHLVNSGDRLRRQGLRYSDAHHESKCKPDLRRVNIFRTPFWLKIPSWSL